MWIITTAARLPGRKVRQQRPAPAKQCRGNANDADNNIKRTEKTVTIDKGNGKTKRCKIYTDMRNAEAIYPYGIYSMCPIIDASEKIA